MNEMDKAKLIKRAFDTGFDYEKNYRGCAQCTLATFFDITGHTEPALFQAASGLSAGIGINGDGSCGGYTGGVLFMSSLIGRRLDRIPINERTGPPSLNHMKWRGRKLCMTGSLRHMEASLAQTSHKEDFGRSYCLREPGVSEAFEEAGAHVDKCTTVVGNACSWVAEILT